MFMLVVGSLVIARATWLGVCNELSAARAAVEKLKVVIVTHSSKLDMAFLNFKSCTSFIIT
jgi:hypothetical protein